MYTGCSTLVLTPQFVNRYSRVSRLVAFDRREVKCRGFSEVELEVDGS